MDMKKALTQCLSERSLGLTRSQIEQIMEDELNKPESEMDCETVELCVELLAQMDDVQLPEVESVPPVSFPAVKRKGHLGRKILLVAAIVVLLTAMALFVSAQVFHVDLVHYTMEKITNGIKVGNRQETDALPDGANVRKELAKCGFESVYLPDSFIEGAQITRWDPQSTDISQSISFLAIKDDKELNVYLVKYNLDDYFDIGGMNIYGDYQNAQEVHLGDLIVLVAEFEDRCSLYLVDDCIEYRINSYNMSVEEICALAKTMKKGE